MVQLGFAAITLMVIGVLCGIVEFEFPMAVVVAAPVPFQLTPLLPARVQLSPVDKICIDHDGERERCSFLCKVCQIYVLVKTSTEIT